MSEALVAKDRNLYLVHLTSLRGIACLVVLIGHVIQVINYHCPDWGFFLNKLTSLADATFNAEGAVLLFFVLSGCVLSLSLSLSNVQKFDFQAIGGFYIKRIFRLYPLLWFSLILAVLSNFFVSRLAEEGAFSDWLKYNVLSGISTKHTILSIAGMYPRYNGPMWSLRAELIYSALFPAIYLCMKNLNLRKFVLPLLLGLAALPIPHNVPTSFALSFAAGALIPLLPAPDRRFAVAAAWFAFFVLLYDRLVLGKLLNPYENLYDIIETACAFVIVRDVYSNSSRYSFLMMRPVVLLGELSFSIYLLHLPIFLILFALSSQAAGLQLLLNHFAPVQILLSLVTAVVTIFISFFTYNYLELPMHNLGRRLARQFTAPGIKPERIVPMPVGRTPLA